MVGSANCKILAATVDFVTSSTASLTHRRLLTCSASRLVPQPPDLIQWVRREGGFVHPNIKIADPSSDGLGVVAVEEIPEGSELFALPGHLPLSFQLSPEPDDVCDCSDSLLVQLAHRVPEELWAMRLGLRLLQERATIGSFWWPYISNLPEAFSMPIFFSGEDIKNLQYAPLLQQVNKRCRFLLEFEKEVQLIIEDVTLKNHPFRGQAVNASSLGWAMSAVSSRAFRLHGEILPNGVHSGTPMLLPLIDMCNHSFHPNSRIVQEQGTSSQNMLVKVNLGGPELIDGRLLAALRVLLASDKEAVGMHDLNTLMSLSEDSPLGVAVETAVLRTIIALCVIVLEHFPTKIMQDESILKGEVPSSTELTVQFRMQKKLMIIDVMRKLTQRVKMLSKEKSTA